MNYKKKDPNIIVSPKVEIYIDKIAKRFKDKFSKVLVVTSGLRTPEQQARAMYNNFRADNGVKIQRRKYRNRKLFDEIAAVFTSNKVKDKVKVINEMTKVIRKQVSRKEYISQHLIESAVDIRTRGLLNEEIDYLVELIKSNASLMYQDKRNSNIPHIHIQLKSCGKAKSQENDQPIRLPFQNQIKTIWV